MADLGDYVVQATSGMLRYTFLADDTVRIHADGWRMAFRNGCCEFGLNPQTAPSGELRLEGELLLRLARRGAVTEVAWQSGAIRGWEEQRPATPPSSPWPSPSWTETLDPVHAPPLLAVHRGEQPLDYTFTCAGDALIVRLGDASHPIGVPPVTLHRVR